MDRLAAVRALSTDEEDSTAAGGGAGAAGEELALITACAPHPSTMTAAQRHRALLRTLHVSSEDIAAADEDADCDDETSLVALAAPSASWMASSASDTYRTDDFCDTPTTTSDTSRLPSHLCPAPSLGPTPTPVPKSPAPPPRPISPAPSPSHALDPDPPL